MSIFKLFPAPGCHFPLFLNPDSLEKSVWVGLGAWRWGTSIHVWGEIVRKASRHRHPEIKRLERKAMTSLDSILKSRDIILLMKGRIVKAMAFPVVTYGYESWSIKKCWLPRNWCFQTEVLEKTLESPLDSKEIKQGNPEGNQPWIFTERANAETPILLPLDVKSQLQYWGHLMGKDPDAGKDWGQEEKGVTEDGMLGWHQWLNRHESEQTLGDREG